MVATDGHRLAYAGTALQSMSPRSEVIIPRKAILELAKLLEDVDEKSKFSCCRIRCASSFGHRFRFESRRRKIPRLHPRHTDQLQEALCCRPVALQQALQRASILSNEKFRGVRWVLTDEQPAHHMQQRRTGRGGRGTRRRLCRRTTGYRFQRLSARRPEQSGHAEVDCCGGRRQQQHVDLDTR